jgi:hypothetical protein
VLLARTEVGGYCAHCQTLRAREVEELRSHPPEPPKVVSGTRGSSPRRRAPLPSRRA